MTVGSLAIRSAGASRGLLSNDEPAPLAVQGPGTSAPQEVAAGSLARTESERAGEPRPGEPAAPGRDPEASVVVISTGGFPLMGATAVGYWRWRGTAPEAVPEMTAPALEARSEGVESTGDPDLDGRPAVLLGRGGSHRQGTGSPPPGLGRLPGVCLLRPRGGNRLDPERCALATDRRL